MSALIEQIPRKTDQFVVRVLPEQRRRLEAIARERYEGNLSMAARWLLALGLEQLERESEVLPAS